MSKVLIVLWLLFALYLVSCAEQQKTLTESASGGSRISQAQIESSEVAKTEGWQESWKRTLEGARKEGKLIAMLWYGTEVKTPVAKVLKTKFGIDAELHTIRGPEMAEKILREKRAGLNLIDLSIHGTGTAANVLKPTGVLEPLEPELILPEVLDARSWFGGKLPFFDKDRYILAFRLDVNTIVLINTSLLKREDLASYKNLLDPRWKGKIVWDDPTSAGPGSFFFRIVGLEYMGLDFMRELAKQEPVITRDRRQLVEWVARGRYAIGLGPDNRIVQTFQEAGSPLEEINPREGGYVTSGGGNLFIMKNAPHPNARRVFVNWFLSREGQTLWSQSVNEQSSREDVPTAHLPSNIIRQPGISYFNTLNEEWQLKREEHLHLAKDVFGHLIK